MEAQKKFKLKRQYKTLVWVEFLSILFWILFIVGAVIIRKHSNADWRKLSIMIPIMSLLILPIFVGMACGMYAGFKHNNLLNYKKAIHRYRARKSLLKVIEHLQMNEIQLAVDEYNKSKVREIPMDDTVYGMIISACLLSSDKELHEIGVKNFNKVINRISPETDDLK